LESDSILAVPESVLLYNHILFVSLVDGQALDADGKGGIAQLDDNGNILNAFWVKGLNDPKGMGIWKINSMLLTFPGCYSGHNKCKDRFYHLCDGAVDYMISRLMIGSYYVSTQRWGTSIVSKTAYQIFI
jgi:hypothetical protein